MLLETWCLEMKCEYCLLSTRGLKLSNKADSIFCSRAPRIEHYTHTLHFKISVAYSVQVLLVFPTCNFHTNYCILQGSHLNCLIIQDHSQFTLSSLSTHHGL
jgi:hypothetical protein